MSEKMDEECRLTVLKIVCGQTGMAFEGKSVSIKSQRTRLPTDASQWIPPNKFSQDNVQMRRNDSRFTPSKKIKGPFGY